MDKRDAAGFCLSLLLNPFSEDFSLFVVVAVVDLFFLLIYKVKKLWKHHNNYYISFGLERGLEFLVDLSG